MRRVAIFAVALFAPASAANAATLTLDHGCYLAKQPALQSGQRIVARADGMAPFSAVTFSFPTGPGAPVQADAAATAIAPFSAPGLIAPQFKASRTPTASDGSNRAAAVVPLRRRAAAFL